MSDFIREVDEEYRRDRAINFLSRYQVPLAILVVAIIAGTGGWRWWADTQVATAEKINDRYMAATDLLKDGKAKEAEAAFDAIERDGAPGYALLSRLRAAAAQQAADPEAAAKAFDAIAEDAGVPSSMRDAARLRGALLRIDRESPQQFEKQYGRYAAGGAGFRNAMRELLALAAMKRQDFAAAGKLLDEIIIDNEAPAAMRGRAEALRGLALSGPATPMTKQPPPAQVTPPPTATPEASDIPATPTLPSH